MSILFVDDIRGKTTAANVKMPAGHIVQTTTMVAVNDVGRSVAGGTYNYVNSGKNQNRFEGQWSNAILDIIDTPTYNLGDTISYQPYWYTSNTSNTMYFGMGSGGAITFYLQEIAG